MSNFTLSVTIVYDNVNYEAENEEENKSDNGSYLEFFGQKDGLDICAFES